MRGIDRSLQVICRLVYIIEEVFYGILIQEDLRGTDTKEVESVPKNFGTHCLSVGKMGPSCPVRIVMFI